MVLGSTNPADRDRALDALASEAAKVLDAHVLAKWFPAAIDPAGGFHQSFAEDWRRLDDGEARAVVHQARLTWTAAATGMDDAARHGLAFLAERQWDAERGGFFWSVDPAGRPVGPWSGEKHSYGQAFAIFAAARCGLNGDGKALALAKAGFDWLDRHARDREHGGYLEVVGLDGSPLRRAGSGRDAVGTPYGLKSANTHLHLLEALTTLQEAWPAAPVVRAALAEVLAIARDRILTAAGAQAPLLTRDWRPLSRAISFGHDLEAAHLLIAAAEQLGAEEVARTLPAARRLADCALSRGWDRRRGGLFHARSARLGRLDRSKVWWVQAEALTALQTMHARFGNETARYGARLVDTWGFVRTRHLDAVHGGWFARLDRAGRPTPGPKSDPWTDPYHQARALTALIQGERRPRRPDVLSSDGQPRRNAPPP